MPEYIPGYSGEEDVEIIDGELVMSETEAEAKEKKKAEEEAPVE